MALKAAYVLPHPPLIIPDVGRGEEKRIQATIDACREVARQIAHLQPETIIITSPHAPAYRDAFYISSGEKACGTMAQYRAPQARVDATYDQALSNEIRRLCISRRVPIVRTESRDGELDHATFIAQWFVDRAFEEAGLNAGAYKVVRIGISGLSYGMHRTVGTCIAQAVENLDRDAVFIASGDLSHVLLADGPYGYQPEGPVFDAEIERIFTEGDLEALFAFDADFCDKAAECGLRSFQMMAAAIGNGWSSELLSHEGPFGVGYAVAQLLPPAPEVDPYVALARASVEHFVRNGSPLPLPDDVPFEMLNTQAGAFVSLHKGGELRGCIGTIAATKEHVAAEIIANGISAASEDPRFDAVRPDELDFLSISVDVLGQAEDINSADELDPKRYGVIVTNGWRRGLLLPDLEGVDTAEQQIAISKRKAGIGANEPVKLQRFEVMRHERGGEAPNDR